MFYVLEPQRNINADDPHATETMFRPCSIAEATVFALFSRKDYTDDPEYLGDIAVDAVLNLIKSAQ